MKWLEKIDNWQFWLGLALINLPFALTGSALNVFGLAGACLALGDKIGERK